MGGVSQTSATSPLSLYPSYNIGYSYERAIALLIGNRKGVVNGLFSLTLAAIILIRGKSPVINNFGKPNKSLDFTPFPPSLS